MIEDIRPGLARWLTPHPEWKPEEDYLDESYRDVASVLHVAPDALVLVDPLVPHSLWPNLDARIEAAGKPVVVLTTIHGHARSRDEVAKRYDAQLGASFRASSHPVPTAPRGTCRTPTPPSPAAAS